MISVAVKELKDNLSKYLNEVENGGAILITKHGRIVAKVTRYDEDIEQEALKKRLAGSVKFYKNPTDPVGMGDWEALDESDA